MKIKGIVVLLVIVSLLSITGCKDITDSYKPGGFGKTAEETEMVKAINEKYGDITASGEPRFLEALMTSSVNNFVPVDQVLKYSKDSDKLYVWFVYDNFNNDELSIKWTYVDEDYIIHTFKSETGEDFGRGTFILEKPDEGWPTGSYEVTIKGAGVSKTVAFEIIEGATISIPLDILSDLKDVTESGLVDEEEAIMPKSGFEAEDTGCSFIGEWTSNWGDMKFEKSENKIVGEYTHDSGKLVGTVVGDVFIGTWSESPSYKAPNDAGDVEFKLSPDCNSFKGNWKYGSESSSWSGGWEAERKDTTIATTGSSSTKPGWYLASTEDKTEITDSHDYYDYDVDYEQGDVTTTVTGAKGEILTVRTTWEQPPEYIEAKGMISMKFKKEGLRVETKDLGLEDSSSVTIDMHDVNLGAATAGKYHLTNEEYGSYLRVGSGDSTGTIKEGVFSAEAPAANAWGGKFRIGIGIMNSKLYGTRYFYEWRE